MVSGFLRTNYRRTGAVLDINAIGPAILDASAAGGAGTKLPYGGFVWMSFAMTAENSAAGVPAGGSHAIFNSTYGLMESYYGAENAVSGYQFMPMGFIPLSVDESNYNNFMGSGPTWLYLMDMGVSGSCWRISFGLSRWEYNSINATLALMNPYCGSATVADHTGIRAIIYGFIVSGP